MAFSAEMDRALEQAGKQWTIKADDVGAEDRPDYVNSLCERQRADVTTVRDVYGGTRHIKSKGTTYLPRHPKEEDQDYERRLQRAVLFNAVRRTAKGLVGMLFRKDPVLKDVPSNIEEHMDNIDLAGRALSVFAKDFALDALLDGHAVIHVEHPPALVDEQGRTSGERVGGLAEERASGVRPYWVQVAKSQILNVQWKLRNGQPFLTLFVYRETATEPKGAFGEVQVEQYRVLRPGSFEVWREVKEDNKLRFELHASGRTSLSYIPVVAAYSEQVGFHESSPPLLDLAYENIDHYQNRNEHKLSLARTRIAMPVFSGLEDDGDNVRWGANYSIVLKGENAKAMMLESTGAALDASRTDLKDTEMRMAALGLSMLVRETRAAETAEAKELDAGEQDSALASFAVSLEDAFGMALWMHADYMKVAREQAGSIECSKDFRRYEINPQMLSVILDAVEKGKLSSQWFWSLLQKGELLPEDFDPDQEREALEQEDGAGLDAIRALMRQQTGEAA